MTTRPLQQVIRQLRRAARLQDQEYRSDGELLESFITSRDEAAFAVLVRRHGPMVLGVCRRVIGSVHDAEDAFQATFLILARKAAAVVPREAVGNWLYGVAYRTGLAARGQLRRRQAREKQVTDMPHPQFEPPDVWPELQPLLDQELSRLPDKYRLPVVLCDLESKGRKDVARQLGLPEGTLSSRLATARRMLAKRLTGRGLAISGGALAAVLSQHAASAAVPLPLAAATVKGAALLAAGQTAAGVISAQAAVLAEGVLKAMLVARLKVTAVFLFVIGIAAVGVGGLVHRSLAVGNAPGVVADDYRAPSSADPSPIHAEAVEANQRPQPKPNPAPAPADAPTVVGRVVAYEPDRSITIESTTRAGTKISAFAIIKGTTRIELPTRVKDIQVGTILPVWADRDDPKLAVHIGQKAAGSKPSGVRPPK
jgi:RNA polymerase sigma factor (sigma-70 family)